jgi:predicted amidophosphoribosyltransferase
MNPAPDLQPGKKKCLKCRKDFDSWDVKSNWICPACTRTNQREYIPRIAGSQVYLDGGASTAIEHDSD